MPRVVFDEDRCKGCELCVNFCPKHIIAMAERLNSRGHRPAAIVETEKCTGCAICAIMCPEVAIEVYR